MRRTVAADTPNRPPRRPRLLFPTTTAAEDNFLGRLLRQETVGGAVVLAAAVIAVVWANTPLSHAYDALRQWQLGPLDLEQWAADGALTLFFFLAGLELKREFLVGSLSNPADAMVPIVAAVVGVLTPAAIYIGINAWSGLDGGSLEGWAIPAATDIAFALAVLAVVGRALPSELRAFLLTLAVVDDLIVIAIIAVFYTSGVEVVPLLLAAAGLAAYYALQRIRGESWLWYVPLAVAIWWFMHESGIHATIAGVAMGLLTRVLPDPGEPASPAERLEHTLTPYSAGLAVPFFALMSAGVAVEGGADLVADPIFLGVALGLVVGKPLGVMAGASLVTRVTRAELNPELSWRDITGVALLAGVGFTVALLVTELSYTGDEGAAAKTAVLAGSVVAALLGAVVLRRRSKVRAVGGSG